MMTDPRPAAVPVRPRIVPRTVRAPSRRSRVQATPDSRPAEPDEVPVSLPGGGPVPAALALRRIELRRGTRRLQDLLDLGDLLALGGAVAAAILVLNFLGSGTEERPAQTDSGAAQAAPIVED